MPTPPADITGRRFGKLTAVSRVGFSPITRMAVWLCKCDCGNWKQARQNNLKRGRTKSCGCIGSGRVPEDLTGRRFGRWTVVAKSARREPGVLWDCRCDCGRTGKVRGSSLRFGSSKSCGCLNREVLRDRWYVVGTEERAP